MTTTVSVPRSIDIALEDLDRQRTSVAALDPGRQKEMLVRLRLRFAEIASHWVEASLQAKRIPPDSPAAAEEWLAGPFCVLRNLRLLERSLAGIERQGSPGLPGPIASTAAGRARVRVLPGDLSDRLFYRGFQAEIRFQSGIEPEAVERKQAGAYRNQQDSGNVALVLGGGNVSSIGPMDVLYKVFAQRKSALLKMHPVNDYLTPLIEEGFGPLIETGQLRVVKGGADVGAYLCSHRHVDEIHITGSDRTHDAIVFGSGPEGRRRRADRKPLLEKPISSELGNVSPVIVVPGPWTAADLDFQAANLASMLTNNAGFNCNAARVIVQHSRWSLRRDLLQAIGRVLASAPLRRAYYPGAFERYEDHVAAHPQARRYGEPGEGELPWTLIPDIPSQADDDPCFRKEAFCGLFAETGLEAESVPQFLDRAVDFANETLWGTLNACLLVHPKTLRDAESARAVERAVDRLRYGTVAVNHWPALGYGLCSTSWGAYPGHPPHDIQSGNGVVHNSYLFDSIEKSVVSGPFRVFPKPAWFLTHPNPVPLARRLTEFEARPSALAAGAVVAAAMRG